MTNRFEALLAPPSLAPKELSVHIRMHPEIPKEVSGAARTELVNVRTRLHDELTTARFGRDLPTDQPDDYRQLLKQVAGADADGIEYRFFASPYAALTKAAGHSPTREEALAAILAWSDPWLTQAWAAQCLRIAEAAELADPTNAGAAWQTAVSLYEDFFDKAVVEDCFTHRFQSDDTARDRCAETWDNFLDDEVAQLASRVESYGRQQNGAAVAACLAALAKPSVARHAPAGAVAAGAAAGLDVFVQGIARAASLKAAVEMYQQCPPDLEEADERGELARALLQAMTHEVELLAKGFGEVDLIDACAVELGPARIDPAGAGALLRAAQTDFFNACAAYARHALNEDQPPAVCAAAAHLLQLVPADWEIGKAGVGNDSIKRDQAAEVLLMRHLKDDVEAKLKALMETPSDSPAEEAALDDFIAFLRQHPDLAAGPQTKELAINALTSIFRNSAGPALHGGAGSRGLRMLEKIYQYLPNDTTVKIGDYEATLSAHIERIKGLGVLVNSLPGAGSGSGSSTRPTLVPNSLSNLTNQPTRRRRRRRGSGNSAQTVAKLLALLMTVALYFGPALWYWRSGGFFPDNAALNRGSLAAYYVIIVLVVPAIIARRRR